MKRILFPVIREASDPLVPTVVKLAGLLDAMIHVLHVVPPSDAFLESRLVADRKWLATFVDGHLNGLTVQVAEVVPGDPVVEILKYSNENHMDLIVIGTHSKKGLDRVYFGSVAEHIVAQSTVPVLSININSSKNVNIE